MYVYLCRRQSGSRCAREIYNPIRFLLFAGNGEIDFYEFLNLMTNTERFLEGFGKFYNKLVHINLPVTIQLNKKTTIILGACSDKQTACSLAIFVESIYDL